MPSPQPCSEVGVIKVLVLQVGDRGTVGSRSQAPAGFDWNLVGCSQGHSLSRSYLRSLQAQSSAYLVGQTAGQQAFLWP